MPPFVAEPRSRPFTEQSASSRRLSCMCARKTPVLSDWPIHSRTAALRLAYPCKRARSSPRLPTKRRRDRTDVSIILTALALLVIGLVMSLSASSIKLAEATGSAFTLFIRQFVWAALGIGALLFFWRFDYRKLRGLTYVLVPISWVLLVATLIPGIGVRAGGASRWIAIGSFSIQPSEFAKLSLILFGADVLSRKMGRLDDWRHIAVPFFVSWEK